MGYSLVRCSDYSQPPGGNSSSKLKGCLKQFCIVITFRWGNSVILSLNSCRKYLNVTFKRVKRCTSLTINVSLSMKRHEHLFACTDIDAHYHCCTLHCVCTVMYSVSTHQKEDLQFYLHQPIKSFAQFLRGEGHVLARIQSRTAVNSFHLYCRGTIDNADTYRPRRKCPH